MSDEDSDGGEHQQLRRASSAYYSVASGESAYGGKSESDGDGEENYSDTGTPAEELVRYTKTALHHAEGTAVVGSAATWILEMMRAGNSGEDSETDDSDRVERRARTTRRADDRVPPPTPAEDVHYSK